jgi:hypothetical protein
MSPMGERVAATGCSSKHRHLSEHPFGVRAEGVGCRV